MYIEQQRIRKHSDFMMQIISHNVYARAVNSRCNLIPHRVEHQFYFSRNLLRPSSLLHLVYKPDLWGREQAFQGTGRDWPWVAVNYILNTSKSWYLWRSAPEKLSEFQPAYPRDIILRCVPQVEVFNKQSGMWIRVAMYSHALVLNPTLPCATPLEVFSPR